MGLEGCKSEWGYRTYTQSNSWGSWACSGWRDEFGVPSIALPVPVKKLLRRQSQVIYEQPEYENEWQWL